MNDYGSKLIMFSYPRSPEDIALRAVFIVKQANSINVAHCQYKIVSKGREINGYISSDWFTAASGQ